MSEAKNMVEFDRKKRDRLRKRYKEAVEKKEDQFEFEGNKYVTSYAKYLLEYLDSKPLS
jgi:hypothetical protein